MKKINLLTLLLLGSVVIFSASTNAQDKVDKTKTDSTKHTMKDMDHSKMDHKMMKEKMESDDTNAKLVDNKTKAWNSLCPVRGGEIDPEANKVEYNGKVYGFCCNGCDSKFMKDPEKYSKNISEDGKEFIGKK